MSRVWTDGSGIPFIAANLNAMEADILAGRSAHGNYQVNVGTVRVDPTGIGYSNYSAFPSLCVRLDESIYMVWRQGTDHVTSYDGKIYSSYSYDNGLTWSAKTLIVTDTLDLRDPSVSMSADQSTMYLTYFKENSTNPQGCFFRTSSDQGVTWSSEVRIDPSYVAAAMTAPVVTLATGSLMAVFYAKALGTEAYYSCYASISSNGGATWGTPTNFANGVSIGQDMDEPYAAVIGSTVIVAHRYGGAANIGTTTSTNSGTSWGTPTSRFAGQGRSSLLATTDGTLICVYRANPGAATVTQHGWMRSSRDQGANWTQPRMVEYANTGGWMYSGLIQVAPGLVLCASASESSSTLSILSLRYLMEGGAVSPYGDEPTPPTRKVVDRQTNIAAVDSFDRANSTTLGRTDNGMPWTAPAAVTLDSGTLYDTTSNLAAGNFSLVDTTATDQDVECEVEWPGSAVSGIYIVLRYQDSSNYYMAGVETSGANARIYKVVAGTATQLGTTASVNMPSTSWHRLRLSAIGPNLRFYFEDQIVVSTSDTTFTTGTQVGVRTGSSVAGTVHRVRNFIATRRNGVTS